MMETDPFSLRYESNFNNNYLRNNKCDGEKNIRCFPQCCSTGHCKVGFCGSSVRAVLTAHDIGSRQALQSLIFVGELLPSDCQPSLPQESIITQALLDSPAAYSKYYTTKNTIFSDQKDATEPKNSVQLEFNTTPKSWGYSYVGHRFKKNQKHKFVVSVLSRTSLVGEENTYKCVGIFDSESFNMQCKRRARPGSQISEEAPLDKRTESTMECTITSVINKPEFSSDIASNFFINPFGVNSECITTMVTDSESTTTADILVPLEVNTNEHLCSVDVDPPLSRLIPDNPSAMKEISCESFSFDSFGSPTNSHKKVHKLSSTGLKDFSPFVHFYPILPSTEISTSASIACSTISVTDSAVRSKPIEAPWPVDIPSNPFGSIGTLDHWCPTYQDGKFLVPQSTHVVSSRRMALIQQLFPKKDITLFCKV